MDGIHDIGGRQGFGPVVVEANEPAFHDRWEAAARALMTTVAGAAGASGGEFRHSIERMDPAHYLTSSYYEHWLTGAATLAVEHRLVTAAELEERAGGRFPLSRPVAPGAGGPGVGSGAEPDGRSPRFVVGDRVRVIDQRPAGHTRCPWYVRGRVGRVVRADGAFSLPDLEAHSDRRVLEATYSVRFDAGELWDDNQAGVVVHVDLWESYLEAAE